MNGGKLLTLHPSPQVQRALGSLNGNQYEHLIEWLKAAKTEVAEHGMLHPDRASYYAGGFAIMRELLELIESQR